MNAFRMLFRLFQCSRSAHQAKVRRFFPERMRWLSLTQLPHFQPHNSQIYSQDNTLFDVLLNGTRLADIIVGTQQERLYLAPSSIDLSAADLLMASAPGRERKLKRALAQLQPESFDYILIDTPPNLGVLTVNAFIACTDVIIPIALTTYALIGISIIERTMQELRD
ncbi:MAG TPA: AAA family ATPase, partial [Ktedonobacteraceae bacterium]